MKLVIKYVISHINIDGFPVVYEAF